MIRVTAAVIERAGKILIARRRPEDRFGGVWEFPGGKIEPGETPEECLRREISEELGLAVALGPCLGTFPYHAADWSIVLIAFRASAADGEPVLRDHDAFRWATPRELLCFDFAEPDRPIVRLLLKEAPRER